MFGRARRPQIVRQISLRPAHIGCPHIDSKSHLVANYETCNGLLEEFLVLQIDMYSEHIAGLESLLQSPNSSNNTIV